uniref:Secreted protein n=1 Tax=Ascaris lumbricoides TaxID=6252 RepID=A0A0M3IJA4_ASCLU
MSSLVIVPFFFCVGNIGSLTHTDDFSMGKGKARWGRATMWEVTI